ncbi:cobalt ABC transporter substrate-binding protein CbiN [Labilibacter sediminis]|nr:cobalt ABC transporter substrate-binding protein CbiN [Labilibacter sediminis]
MTKKKIIMPYVLVFLPGLLVIAFQVFMSGFFSEHTGTDDQSVDVIRQIAPNYTPWFDNVLEFDNELSEPLLFILQASVGIGIIALYIIKQHRKKV